VTKNLYNQNITTEETIFNLRLIDTQGFTAASGHLRPPHYDATLTGTINYDYLHSSCTGASPPTRRYLNHTDFYSGDMRLFPDQYCNSMKSQGQ
jgi:hypothetical protein